MIVTKKCIGSRRSFIGVIALTLGVILLVPRTSSSQELELPAQSQPSSPPPKLHSIPAPQNELQIPVQRQPTKPPPPSLRLPGRREALTPPATLRRGSDFGTH